MADQDEEKDEVQDKLKKGAKELVKKVPALKDVKGAGAVAGLVASTGYGAGKIMAQPAGEGGINGGSFERTKEAQSQMAKNVPLVGKWLNKTINNSWAKRNGGIDNGDGTYTMPNGSQYDPRQAPSADHVDKPNEMKEDPSVKPDESAQQDSQPGVA